MAAWVHDEGMAQGGRMRQEDDYGVFELPPELEAGDLLLVLADVTGRMIARPGEVDASIITAFIGAPVFIWIVRRRRVAAL